MITATTITATTITVMRPRQFVITVTMRIPRTHAPPMDTGDQISSLTVYSSAPARGSPVGTDKAITVAVVMADTADTAADVAVTAAVAGDTAVAVILQEDVADTPGDMVGMLAVDIVGTVPDSVVVAVSTARASARTAAVVVTAVMVTAVVMVTVVAVTGVMVTAVADTKSAISSRLGEKGWLWPAFLFCPVTRASSTGRCNTI
jgi:hypothetical protein